MSLKSQVLQSANVCLVQRLTKRCQEKSYSEFGISLLKIRHINLGFAQSVSSPSSGEDGAVRRQMGSSLSSNYTILSKSLSSSFLE